MAAVLVAPAGAVEWSSGTAMPTSRAELGAAAVGGKVYAVGGDDSQYGYTDTVYAYSPSSQSWATDVPSMSTARQRPGVTAAGGRLYAIGGCCFSKSVEAYTPGAGSWTPVNAMSVGRYALGAASLNGLVYAVGGFNGAGVTGAVEAYNPDTGSWIARAPLDTPRYDLAVVAGDDGRIYAIGGSAAGGVSSAVEAYNPVTNAWTTLKPLLTARYGLAAALGADGRIYTMGGSTSGGAVSTVEIYSPDTNTWTTGPAMTTGRKYLAAATAPDGSIHALGGQSASRLLASNQILSAAAPPGTPSAPTNVTATAGNASATVTWTPPTTTGGSALASYTVTASPGSATKTVTGSPLATSTTVTGLTNGTAYTFKVTATNEAGGTGPASIASNAVTPRTVPDAPTDVTASPGDGLATVSWAAPAINGGSAITSYTVSASPGTATKTVTGSPPATSALVSGLTNGTGYTFTVTATNVAGTGPASAPSSSVTPRAAPSAPTNVSAAAGNASATVTWAAPSSTGGSQLVSYTVTASPGGATKTVTGSPPAKFTTVTELTNGTAYTFKVTATNEAGATGPASAASNTVTPQGPPGAPTSVNATPGNGSASVSWVEPEDGGATITAYVITAYAGGVAIGTLRVSAPASSATVAGLDNGTAYTFTVTAGNYIGEGPESAQSDPPVTPRTVPGVPTQVTARAPDDGSVNLTWNAPASDGGASIDHYVVTANSGGSVVDSVSVLAPASATTYTGLPKGKLYKFKVTAWNAAGAGLTSVASNEVTVISPPGAPTNVVATAGNASATVSWTPPSDNGGVPISYYQVVAYCGTAPCLLPPVTVDPALTTATFEGLTNGTTYSFTVTATNSVRAGKESAASNSVTPRAPVATYQEDNPAITYVNTWTTKVCDCHSGGAAKMSIVKGASAKLSFTGTRVQWVSSIGPTRGSAQVYLDGVLTTTVKTYSAVRQDQVVVWSSPVLSQGSHRVKIVVLATAGHPAVYLDAFKVIS